MKELISYFSFPVVEGTNNIIPICVVSGSEVIGWTAASSPNDVEYEAWRLIESLENFDD